MTKGFTPVHMDAFLLTVRNEYAYACSLAHAMAYQAKNPLPGLFVPSQKCLLALGAHSIFPIGQLWRFFELAAF